VGLPRKPPVFLHLFECLNLDLAMLRAELSEVRDIGAWCRK